MSATGRSRGGPVSQSISSPPRSSWRGSAMSICRRSAPRPRAAKPESGASGSAFGGSSTQSLRAPRLSWRCSRRRRSPNRGQAASYATRRIGVSVTAAGSPRSLSTGMVSPCITSASPIAAREPPPQPSPASRGGSHNPPSLAGEGGARRVSDGRVGASAFPDDRALLLEAGAQGLGGEAALTGGGARPGGAAQAGRGRGADDQGDEAVERVGPVALLRAEALGGD